MKKKFLIDILIFIAAFGCVFFVSRSDHARFDTTLNHNGLSDQALVIHTNSKATMKQVVTRLHDAKLKNYQVHFNANSTTTYFYGQGRYSTLPLISGRVFSDNDFESQIPVVLVGKKQAKKLYTPASQSYLKREDRYLSVIGVVGIPDNTKIDNHLFISISPKYVFDNQSIHGMQIIIDGSTIGQQRKQIQQVFNASRLTKYESQSTPFVGTTWLQAHGVLIAELVGVVIVLLILSEIFFQLQRQDIAQAQLDQTLQTKYRRGLLRRFSVHAGFSLLLGLLLGFWRLYLIHYALTGGFILIIFVLMLLYFDWRIRRSLPKTLIKGD